MTSVMSPARVGPCKDTRTESISSSEGGLEDEAKLLAPSELSDLASKLQDCLGNANLHEEALLEAISVSNYLGRVPVTAHTHVLIGFL